MQEELWDPFVIYVNAFYAVQEAHDAARRRWERPATGLEEFCRDANPFLWDEEGSAEEGLYEGFLQEFKHRFPKGCTAADGHAYAREWLATIEGDAYGTSLVDALDETCDVISWTEACEPIEHQIRNRAVRLERTPQDLPEPTLEPALRPLADDQAQPAAPTQGESPEPPMPSEADIEAVIAMLAKGDEQFAASLRARLAEDDE